MEPFHCTKGYLFMVGKCCLDYVLQEKIIQELFTERFSVKTPFFKVCVMISEHVLFLTNV